MPAFHRAYVSGRWGQLHLRIAPGDRGGCPLLLLHQTPKSGWLWEPMLPLLSPGRTCVAVDTPGYGASDAPPPGHQVEIEDYAAAAAEAMDVLAKAGIQPGGRFDVMGYHTGSALAVALARSMPDRVRRVVTIALPGFTAEEQAHNRTVFPSHPVLKEDGTHLIAMWQGLERLNDARAPIDWKQGSLLQNLIAGPGSYRGFEAIFRYDLLADLPHLTQPLLVINPEDDLYNETKRAAALVPAAEIVVLPGTGHGLFVVAGRHIAKVVNGFLAR